MPASRDFSLCSTRVVTADGVRPATLLLDGTRIAAIEPHASADIDYGDLVIMPGLVDSHVHVNEPGRTEWEGFATATRAARAGGITTIVDMPLNSLPPTTTVAALELKQQHARGDVSVELWGGVVPGNTRELRPMLERGARGFKCFLVHSGVDEFPNVNERELYEAARELAGTNAPLLVHAELGEHLHEPSGDPNEYATYLHSRPNAAEDAAIELVARVCRDTGARMHIVHLSSASALRHLDKSLPLTAETTPHYLHFEAESVPRGRTEFKCAPPIRERSNREELWRGLASGAIDLVVSDHSPCTPELKKGDFANAWGGIASLQFVLPIVWTNARRRGFTIEDVARWCCAAPARLANLDRKGAIAAGNDADLVVWDPDATFTVTADLIQHRHKVTPYLGAELQGVVRATWTRGTLRAP
ncbi:MAG TPA: allantoinase AllB [Thermoanaerobaculia bacterium]|jgi:allantoinase|nr:allantoinase AllB [Thermoanaerobaculia bacterium]